MIKLTNIQKTYHKNKSNALKVIDNTSLSLEDKGLVVLLGNSGSGKTTLLNVLGGLDKPDKGSIDFFGKQLPKYQSGKWDQIRSTHIGYVFQNYYLLPNLSIYDNVSYVLKMLGITDLDEIDKRVIYVLKAVGLYPYRRKKALQLSGGQQQRAAIARAIVKNPKVIIADEPTGNLDSKNSLEVMNILKEISKEKLVVLVTHDEELANFYADRIIRIKDGKIIKDESHKASDLTKIGQDDTIYLKDLTKLAESKETHLKASYYTDQTNSENIDIRLIFKNDTLYIDVKDYQKRIVLLDSEHEIKIKNESYQAKSKEETLHTHFDTSFLETKNLKKEKKLDFNLKRLLLNFMTRFSQISNKGKLVFLSLIISGIFLAFSTSLISYLIIPKPETKLTLSEDFIRINTQKLDTSKKMDFYDYILDQNYIPYDVFFTSENIYSDFRFEGYSTSIDFIEPIDLLDPNRIIKGILPQRDDQILISSSFGKDGMEPLESSGILNIEYLVGEKVIIDNETYEVTGLVSNPKGSIIYTTSNALISFNKKTLGHASYDALGYNPSYAHYKMINFNENNLTEGRLPLDQTEMVVSDALKNIINNQESTFFKNYKVVGYYDDLTNYDHIISPDELYNQEVNLYFKDFKTAYVNMHKDYNDSFYLFSDTYLISHKRAELLIEDFNAFSHREDLKMISTYQDQVEIDQNQRNSAAQFTLPALLILVSISLLGFYFLNKSSLINRVYHIGVLRSLGVNKLLVSMDYVLEVLITVTITAIPGYLLGTYLTNSIIDYANILPFYNTWYTFLIGFIFIYAIYIFIGYLPMLLLLRKTPAQIISKYDL